MKRWVNVAIVVLASTFTVWAQEDWQIEDAQNTVDVFETRVRNVSLSPDGTILAGAGEGQICIVRLASTDEECFSTETVFHGHIWGMPDRHNALVWSPDSTTLLFTELLYTHAHESDLWTLDTTTGELTNHTDDGVEGSFAELDGTDFTLDYLPAYAPNGDIYFFRSEPDLNGNLNLTLQRLSAGNETPELVSDLTLILPAFSVFYAPVVSPDGTHIAFPVETTDPHAPENGLWWVNLENGEAHQLVSSSDTYTGIPASQRDFRLLIVNPVWAANGAGIVFRTYSPENAVIPGNFLYVDVNSGDLTPMIDLSDFPPLEEAVQIGEDGDSEMIRFARDGAVSADGSTFVYLRFDTISTNAQIASVPIPPDGSEPSILGSVEFSPFTFVPNPLMSDDGKALLGGWLYTFGR